MVSMACSFILDSSTTGCQKLPDVVMALLDILIHIHSIPEKDLQSMVITPQNKNHTPSPGQ